MSLSHWLILIGATWAIAQARSLHFHYGAWRFYRDRNEAALRESGLPLGGSMTFSEYLRRPSARMIYGARYAETLKPITDLRNPIHKN